MSLKNQWLMNIAMVLLSWLSLFFIGKRNIKRFLPASVLICFLEAINVQLEKNENGGYFIISQSHMFQESCLLILAHFLYFQCGY